MNGIELTAEAILSIVRYEPETGKFYWLSRPDGKKHNVFNSIRAGKEAGTLRVEKDGYSRIFLKLYGKLYSASRIAYIIHHGSIPDGFLIDHINGIATDNKICNLRLATVSQNAKNKKMSSLSTTGYKGVYRQSRKTWRARAESNGVAVMKAGFRCPTAAAIAYDKMAIKMNGVFAKTNILQQIK